LNVDLTAGLYGKKEIKKSQLHAEPKKQMQTTAFCDITPCTLDVSEENLTSIMLIDRGEY
jgi:hypothetical protein